MPAGLERIKFGKFFLIGQFTMAKKRARKKSPIEQRLADAADYEGLMVDDLATDPRLLKKHKIKGIDERVIQHARAYHRDRMNEIVRIADDRNAEIEKAARQEMGLNDDSETETKEEPQGQETMAATITSRTGTRQLVWDKYAATAMIRWMGVKKWGFDQARYAMNKIGSEVADATIRIQLRRGKAGQAEPAKLNRAEQKKLNAMKKAVK